MERKDIKVLFQALFFEDASFRMKLQNTQRSRAKLRRKRTERRNTGQIPVTSSFIPADAYDKHLKNYGRKISERPTSKRKENKNMARGFGSIIRKSLYR
eukprot:UN18501